MRKMKRWLPEEASTLYWLTLWGLTNKEVVDLSKDILIDRSYDSIHAFVVDTRKYISICRKFEVSVKPNPSQIEVLRKGAKIQPIKAIADLKPADLHSVVFKHAGTYPGHKGIVKKTNFPQLKDGEENLKGFKNLGWQELNGKQLNKNGEQLGMFEAVKLPGSETYIAGQKIGGEIANTVLSAKKPKLEDVLQIAKNAGAKKVEWNGFTIKF